MMAEAYNPYHPLSPPDNPALFFGREDTLAFLQGRLVGGQNADPVLLIGREGIGKTALLWQIFHTVDERYQPVYFSPTSVAAPLEENTLLLGIAREIVAQMTLSGFSTYRLPPPPETSSPREVVRAWFADEFLEVALTAIHRGRFLLLLYDNLHLWFEGIERYTIGADFPDYWNSLLTRYERFDLIAALDLAYEERLLSYNFANKPHLQIRLAPLEPKSARALIRVPLQDELTLSEEAIERILTLCGGNPFLLHSVCRLMVRQVLGSGQTRVSAALIDHIYPAALSEAAYILQPLWGRFSTAERAILRAMALPPTPQTEFSPADLNKALQREKIRLNETRLLSLLRGLEYQQFIQATPEGKYRFLTHLEADWLREQFQGETSIVPSARRDTRWRALGFVAFLLALMLVGVILVVALSGAVDSRPAPPRVLPPTATLETR